MCNAYAYTTPHHRLLEAFGATDLTLVSPPDNAPPRERIAPTDPAPIVRLADRAGGVALAQVRWGFAPPRPKAGPVINFRSEGRRFAQGRCLALSDGFFEFTGARSPKTRWRFTMSGETVFAMAALWRGEGEAARFSLLTIAPGADVAPYHDRQIVPLAPARWAAWLGGAPEAEVLRPGPAGSLQVVRDN